MNQSEFTAVMCNLLKAREKSLVQGAVDIDFASHWLENWREILRRIPFKVRAITCKNYLIKVYSQHGNFLNAI